MTAVVIQRIAMLACYDHEEASPTELEVLAAIGSYGKFPGNCYRDLMRIIQPGLILTKTLLKFKVPLLSLKRIAGRQVGRGFLNLFCPMIGAKVPTAFAENKNIESKLLVLVLERSRTMYFDSFFLL